LSQAFSAKYSCQLANILFYQIFFSSSFSLFIFSLFLPHMVHGQTDGVQLFLIALAG